MRPQVKIIFKEDSITSLKVVESELPETVNVANPADILEGIGDGYRGFQVSQTKVATLDGTYRVYTERGYPGVITKTLSSSDGTCDISIPVHITGDTPKNLYISFDKVAKEYAKAFTLTNSVNKFTIKRDNNTEAELTLPLASLMLPAALDDATFTLKITKWSKPNASIKLTRFSSQYVATYTGKDIVSLVYSENLLDSQMQILPGICEQYANISVLDRYNALRKRALRDELHGDYVVNIASIDDESGISYTEGSYIISDWDFKSTSSQVDISCRDKSYLFEKINIERVGIKDRTLDDFINIMFTQAKNMTWRYLDGDTQERCRSINVPNSWYTASDLNTMLSKVCALGMLRIYWYVDTFIIGRCA